MTPKILRFSGLTLNSIFQESHETLLDFGPKVEIGLVHAFIFDVELSLDAFIAFISGTNIGSTKRTRLELSSCIHFESLRSIFLSIIKGICKAVDSSKLFRVISITAHPTNVRQLVNQMKKEKTFELVHRKIGEFLFRKTHPKFKSLAMEVTFFGSQIELKLVDI